MSTDKEPRATMETQDIFVEIKPGSFTYAKCTCCERGCERFVKWQDIFDKCQIPVDSVAVQFHKN